LKRKGLRAHRTNIYPRLSPSSNVKANVQVGRPVSRQTTNPIGIMNQQFFFMKAHDLGGRAPKQDQNALKHLYEGRDRRAETSSGSDRSNEEETTTRYRMINGRKARLPLRQFGNADDIGRIFHWHRPICGQNAGTAVRRSAHRAICDSSAAVCATVCPDLHRFRR
jgi:hypothetical protein